MSFYGILLPTWVDIASVTIGSLQGAMFAGEFKRIDWMGVSVIGICTGLGGGIVRDVLIGVTPAAFQNNLYLLVAVVAAFSSMLLRWVFTKLDPAILVLDALILGLFAGIGTTKALSAGLPFAPAIFIGCLATVGGSILRDIFLNLPIAMLHVGSFYSVASLVGASVLVGLLELGQPVLVAFAACTVITTSLRLCAVHFGWSLPEQKALSLYRKNRSQGQ
jgi:uncharacterized membrane protein YeiH